MFHTRDIINLLIAHGYRITELADVGSATRRGTLYEVIDGRGDVAVMSLTTPADLSKTADAHPGVPASLYMPNTPK